MPKSIPKKAYAGPIPPCGPITLEPIGQVCSPHLERHGTPHQAVIPAQPQHRAAEEAVIELFTDRVPATALQDLDGFDYVWVLAFLHLNQGFRPLLAPPRDREHKRGLFATRAPHRPNPLGLSAARILRVEGPRVYLERLDLLNGTPVLDLKPYVPYADAFPDAAAGWLENLERPVP